MSMRPLASLLLALLLSLAGMASESRASIGEMHAGWGGRAAVLEQAAPVRVVVLRAAPVIASSVHPGTGAAPADVWRLAVPLVAHGAATRAPVPPVSARRLAFPYDATAPPAPLA